MIFFVKAPWAALGVFLTSQSAWANRSQNFFGLHPHSKFYGVQIGVITYSFRSMPGSAQQILQYCIDANISAIELMGDAIEDYAGKPANPIKMGPGVPGQPMKLTDEQKMQMAGYQKQVAEWRAGVSMDKFEEIRNWR